MNFVDAALELLEEAQKPVHVSELCRLAVERELLTSPGKNPLRSMKGRLTLESKKGDESRITKVEKDIWVLKDLSESDDAESKSKSELGTESESEDEGSKGASSPEDGNDKDAQDAKGSAEQLSSDPEVASLQKLYGDEAKETLSAAVINEYRDSQTADEDRPMLPEIKAERGGRGQRPRRKRRERTPSEGAKTSSRGRSPRQDSDSASAPPLSAEPPRPSRVRPTLADLDIDLDGAPPWVAFAAEILAGAEQGQSLPIRQLVQTMVQNGHIPGPEERFRRQVKGVLILDEHRRLADGLKPRVVHRGNGLFALSNDAAQDELADAEMLFNAAHRALESAHRKHFAKRISKLSPKMLQRVAQVYLHDAGYQDVEWVKQLEDGCYAKALDPMTQCEVLIGLRPGGQEIDRKGVGELRAGLVAKEISEGLLMSPANLGSEAKDEYKKEGPPVRLLCGDAFYNALQRSGVGFTRRVVAFSTQSDALIDAILG